MPKPRPSPTCGIGIGAGGAWKSSPSSTAVGFSTREQERLGALVLRIADHLIRRTVLDDVAVEPTNTASADHVQRATLGADSSGPSAGALGKRISCALAEWSLFDQLQKSLAIEPYHPSQADTAHEFGMKETAVKQAFHQLRQRYRQLLREEVAHTVMVPGDIEDELRRLNCRTCAPTRFVATPMRWNTILPSSLRF